MAAIMEYKLDADAGNILWISDEGHVVLEIGDVWKWGRHRNENDLWEDRDFRFYINRDVTTTEVGIALLAYWENQGRPTKNIQFRPTKAYCAEMAWAPPFVQTLFLDLDECLAAGMRHSVDKTGLPTLMLRVCTEA